MLGAETDRLTNGDLISLWSRSATDAGHPREARQADRDDHEPQDHIECSHVCLDASVAVSRYENSAAWWDQGNPIENDLSRSDTRGASRGLRTLQDCWVVSK